MPQDHYLEPYRRSQRRFGTAFPVTLWADPQSQTRRFEVMANLCFLPGKRILDAGCSRGDFAAFLIERDIPFGRLIGIDALPEVVRYAQSRRFPRCEFHGGDFLTQPALWSKGDPQVVCISGALNTMAEKEVFATLEHAWRVAGQTLAFNFLSDRAGPGAPPQPGPPYRLDTLRLLDWALTKTPQVAFRQDYFKHGHDATIVMRKE
jgi:hypothetical protein